MPLPRFKAIRFRYVPSRHRSQRRRKALRRLHLGTPAARAPRLRGGPPRLRRPPRTPRPGRRHPAGRSGGRKRSCRRAPTHPRRLPGSTLFAPATRASPPRHRCPISWVRCPLASRLAESQPSTSWVPPRLRPILGPSTTTATRSLTSSTTISILLPRPLLLAARAAPLRGSLVAGR